MKEINLFGYDYVIDNNNNVYAIHYESTSLGRMDTENHKFFIHLEPTYDFKETKNKAELVASFLENEWTVECE